MVLETLNRCGVAAIGLAVCGDVAKPSIGTLQLLTGIPVEPVRHADSPAQTGSGDTYRTRAPRAAKIFTI